MSAEFAAMEQANGDSGVGGGIWPKFKFIQAFMYVLVTCKNENDQIKHEGARVFTRFLPLYTQQKRNAYSDIFLFILPFLVQFVL